MTDIYISTDHFFFNSTCLSKFSQCGSRLSSSAVVDLLVRIIFTFVLWHPRIASHGKGPTEAVAAIVISGLDNVAFKSAACFFKYIDAAPELVLTILPPM